MDPEVTATKELIALALEECTDTDTLNLVYALLVYDKTEGQSL